jgi:hypothetical protein
MPYKDKEKKKEYQKQRYLKNRETILAKTIQWQKDNKDIVNAKNLKWKHDNKKNVLESSYRYRKECKEKIYAHYGNKCNICGSEKNLHLDHINNDGSSHRKEYKGNIDVWAIRNKYPDNLQILCQVCNEHKKRALYLNMDVLTWKSIYKKTIDAIKKLRDSGITFVGVSAITGVSLSNVANIYYRHCKNV